MIFRRVYPALESYSVSGVENKKKVLYSCCYTNQTNPKDPGRCENC